MILSASRRTDIPAFHMEWFMNRLRAGFSLVRNPMNHAQISRVPLSPDVVDCIVFWSKDPGNLLPYLAEIDKMGYDYYFQFTLTPYGREIEPNLRDKGDIAATFCELAGKIGRERALWRYDPIILNESLDISWHCEKFARLCDKLQNSTECVNISFVDLYAKLKTALIREITKPEMLEIGEKFAKIAENHGLEIRVCCENANLTQFGVTQASCIDRTLIERICGFEIAGAPDKTQREGCGCIASVDIGAYDTCKHGCVYCYANRSAEAVLRRLQSCSPDSGMLFGEPGENEKVSDRVVKSLKKRQMNTIGGL